MQLNLQQLNQHLKGKLLPVYLISSDIALLNQEARDAIYQAAQQAGFGQRQRLEVESGFHWQELMTVANSYSLFAEQTLIELHNPAAKFETEAGKILQSYCENLPTDKILLIVSSKLSSAQQKTRWYKCLSDCGAVVQIWPVKSRELPQWIQNRMQSLQIKADAASIRMLAEFTEGNLLATQQALIKLRLIYPDQKIGVKEMAEAISDSAQFNVFELSQYILQNDSRSIVRILEHLRATGVEPILVLWLLARESREIIQMLEKIRRGQSPQAAAAGQWPSVQALYQNALRRMNLTQIKKILLSCQEIDQMIKGAAPGDPWNALTQSSLALAGFAC